jgi:ribosomal protein L11 methyltransferase
MPTVKLVISTTKKLAPRVSELLFAAGAGGLEERPGRGTTLVAYGESKAALAAIWKRAEKALIAELPKKLLPSASIEVDKEEAWRTAWTEHLRPVALTPRLVLAPTTADAPTLRQQQTAIWYQPALAFGDGDHPTTRLASRAIEAHYRAHPGGALLDIGAGTGVLSFVALLSGAKRALGTDISAEAIEAAATNASINGLSKRARFVDVAARVSGSFDLCVINIELRPLLVVLGALPAAARKAPKLLVTGLLDSQVAEVSAALKAAGFRLVSRKSEGEWRLLVAEKSG